MLLYVLLMWDKCRMVWYGIVLKDSPQREVLATHEGWWADKREENGRTDKDYNSL